MTTVIYSRFLEEHPDKLGTIKVLDPACGSGAFLNQAHSYLMQEYETRLEQRLLEKSGLQQLDFSDINLAASNRSILLDNLFGVDLNQESVEITKLSLWLKTARASEPLENLDKNIKCGNSIVDDPIYAGARAFNWNDEFRNILNDGGFDVIIGNPPYVRQELIKDIKPYLEKKYRVYTGVSDLYVYFFERAMSLLKENGFFAFIVSNKFLRAGYGQKLTQYLQQNFTILNLIDFGDLQIFEGATTYPCIIIMQKKKPADIQRVPLLKLTSLERVGNLALEAKENSLTIEIKKDDISWQLRSIEENNILVKLKKDGTPLNNFVSGQILRGIVTGFNDAFIIDDLTRERLCKEDTKSTEIIKPILRGKDINRYRSSWENLWMIFTRRGTDINKYPAVLTYLKQFQKNLEPGVGRKPGTYKWFEIQDNIAYFREFQKPKIIWGNLATSASFTFDTEGYYICAPACILPTEHKWLLAILNSSVSAFFLRNTAIERQGGFIEQKPVYVNQIPIPNVNDDIRKVLTEKVEMLLDLNLRIQALQKQALEVLKAEYMLPKATQKIEKFLDLGWNEFIEELEKQKVRLDLTQKDKLNVWFRSKQSEAKKLEEDMEKLNNEIDKSVYKLYDLNDAEIRLIERDNSN